ncbi:hypothetical protein K1719_000426 [Acacia pycnantha]|nr:hypothetical protein K1719_000426 [Acacia pycnantha]
MKSRLVAASLNLPPDSLPELAFAVVPFASPFRHYIKKIAIFQARTWLSRSFATLSSNSLRVCVVGSGPAGFYTAEKMLKSYQEAQVDIIDRLPTPFGLVRSGVAPDHPETKIVINQFSRIAQHERCSLFGNVALGSSVSLSELCELYHVVVLTYGAENDRSLGISGEKLKGVHSAREFVCWYNGHPDARNLDPDLKSTDTAVILGQGNVALDVARIVLRPTSELATTDISSHALGALEGSSIRKVYLVGRRGPAQAACTAKELREVLGIHNLNIKIQETDLLLTPTDEEELKCSRIQRRVYELLSKATTSKPAHAGLNQRKLHFVFFRKPNSFQDSRGRIGHVSSVCFEKTVLQGWYLRALVTDEYLLMAYLLIIRKVSSILEDLNKGVLVSPSALPKQGREGLRQLLHGRNVRIVSFSDWEKIDSEEKRRGSTINKPREKLATWEELLQSASG